MFKKISAVFLLLACSASLAACSCSAQSAPIPKTTPLRTQVRAEGVNWPKEKLPLNKKGEPQLRVYVVDEQAVQTMEIENYIAGVLAGEMKNTWPMEALKAQAILARTFVLKFVQEKESKYPDADISTDIEEAQAYSAADVDDRILQAVNETRGLVLSCEGELPYAWFHAHSGGATDLATVGLGWNEAEPAYTQCTSGQEPETAADEADSQSLHEAQRWSASFPLETLETALAKLGVDIPLSDGTAISVGERGDSGRAATILIDGKSVDAADLRIALGSTEMRSTLLSSLSVRNSTVYMSGKGYGHGVGMSQWGAYGMAQQGKTAEEIVMHFFRNVTLEKLW